MADTSELLRLATDGSAEEYWHACADPALKASKLATALKSRLQAEAPEDAEVAAVEKWLHDNPPRAVQSRTSQAEAQAPASVLTLTADDVEVLKSAWCREAWNSVTDSYHYSCNYCAAPDVDSASDEIKHTADCLTHRLTVGAPAPAPTREQVELVAGEVCPFLSTVDRARLAKAFIALFAKGGTP